MTRARGGISTKQGSSAGRGLRNLFKSYQRRCRIRNVYFDLTIEEFNAITKKLCFYCEKPPASKVGEYIYNGIDRTDPKRGYSYDNSVACCTECNRIKSNILTKDEMLVVSASLKAFRKSKAK